MPISDQKGRVHWRIASNNTAKDPIDANTLGVLFNRSMQTFGYFNGEIVFKVKVGQRVKKINAAGQTEAQLVTHPDVYAIMTHSAEAFLLTLRELQKRSEVQWVEPTVRYVGTEEAAK